MYDDLVHTRQDICGGVTPWMWIKTDAGAWDGPKEDWEHSHLAAIKEHVTDWSNCIQAGGCQGMYPRLLSDLFQNVYTFEPDSLSFHCLVNNCQKDNVFKINAALGTEAGFARVNRMTMSNVGCHTVHTDGHCVVPMMTIDSFKLPTCGLFQLDLETYEIHALRGALETIERCKPIIQCENGNDDILNLLRPFGYEKVATSRADTIYKVV